MPEILEILWETTKYLIVFVGGVGVGFVLAMEFQHYADHKKN